MAPKSPSSARAGKKPPPKSKVPAPVSKAAARPPAKPAKAPAKAPEPAKKAVGKGAPPAAAPAPGAPPPAAAGPVKKVAAKKGPKKPAAPRAPQRLKIVWAVCDHTLKTIKTFPYPERKAAEQEKARLEKAKGKEHVVRPERVPMTAPAEARQAR